MYSALSQVKSEYTVSELPYICEFVVANLSRTTWAKPWTCWFSVRHSFSILSRVALMI